MTGAEGVRAEPVTIVPCRQCGNPRPINAYCSATDACRAAADEHAAKMQALVTGARPVATPDVVALIRRGRT